MIETVLAALETAAELAESHPALTRILIQGVKTLLHMNTQPSVSTEAVAAQVAGLAAARAQAVQAAQRRVKPT